MEAVLSQERIEGLVNAVAGVVRHFACEVEKRDAETIVVFNVLLSLSFLLFKAKGGDYEEFFGEKGAEVFHQLKRYFPQVVASAHFSLEKALYSKSAARALYILSFSQAAEALGVSDGFTHAFCAFALTSLFTQLFLEERREGKSTEEAVLRSLNLIFSDVGRIRFVASIPLLAYKTLKEFQEENSV